MNYKVINTEEGYIEKIIYECSVCEALIINCLLADAYRDFENTHPQDMQLIIRMRQAIKEGRKKAYE